MSAQLHAALDVESAVAVLTFDRASKRNAITQQMMEELIAALDSLAGDDRCKVVVVTGAGGVFSAGWDRAELLDHAEPFRSGYVEVALGFYRSLIAFPKPMVAAVEGYALGTAFDVALLCDVRVCGADARFAHPEVKLGGPCLYTPLKDVVGAGWARELCLSGRSVDAATAERIGLVNRVASDGDVLGEAVRLAAEMTEVPLDTLRYTKSYLWTHPAPEEWLEAELVHVMRHGMTIRS